MACTRTCFRAELGGHDPLYEAHERIEKLHTALEAIAGFGSVNLDGEWSEGLRDIIRSMTDCAREALKTAERG